MEIQGVALTVTVEEVLGAIGREGAWKWMVRSYLADQVRCPACGSAITGERALARFREMQRTFCKSCQKEFAPTAGTPIAGTSWQPEEFIRLIILHQVGRRVSEIAAALGKSGHAVRDMLERIQLQPPGVLDTHCPAAPTS